MSQKERDAFVAGGVTYRMEYEGDFDNTHARKWLEAEALRRYPDETPLRDQFQFPRPDLPDETPEPAEGTGLVKSLLPYLSHKKSCIKLRFHETDMECDCGLDDALRAQPPKETKG